jgi:hypothetical protein
MDSCIPPIPPARYTSLLPNPIPFPTFKTNFFLYSSHETLDPSLQTTK